MISISFSPIKSSFSSRILPYLGIFLVLISGSYIMNLSADSFFFNGLKYAVAAGLIALGINFYFKKDIGNFLKLTLFIAFTMDYKLHIIFIFAVLLLFNKKLLAPFNSALKPIYVLFGFGFFSYLVNQFVEVNILSFPLFTFTFFLPFIFFGLYYNYGNEFKDELISFFYNVVLIMTVVIILQVILHPKLHPDYWNGGTPNAHIAAAYLSIAFLMCTAKIMRLKKISFKENLRELTISIITLPILFLTDAKYFFLLTLFILIGFFIISPSISRRAKAFSVGVIAIMSVIFFSTPEKPIPISILTIHPNSYNFEKVNTEFQSSPKYKLLSAAVHLPVEEPLAFLIGSGPGSFISRAALLQFNLSNQENRKIYNYGRENVFFTSSIALGDTWMRSKYAKDAFPDNFDPGSLFNRRSGLISLFFELGIIGLSLFAWFHLGIIKSLLNKKTPANNKYKVEIILLVILFFTINYFSYWCEYPNYLIVQYGVLGILLAHSKK